MKTALKAIRNGSDIKTLAENFKVAESTIKDQLKFGGDYSPSMGWNWHRLNKQKENAKLCQNYLSKLLNNTGSFNLDISKQGANTKIK